VRGGAPVSLAVVDASRALPDAACPDVYFTAGYGRAAALTRGGDWELLRDDDRILLPYVRTPAGGGGFDAASPYGYSGLYVAPGCPPHRVAGFWAQARRSLRSAGVVAVFLRCSPLDEAGTAALGALDGVRLTRRGDTVTVPVAAGPDAVWAGMRGRSRTAVRKAEQAGLAGDIRAAEPADLAPDGPFRRLYADTMRRVGGAAGYLFGDDYYAALRTGLGPGLRLARVRDRAGDVQAAALVLVHGGRVHYHLSGSTAAGGRAGANNLLLWSILRWAAERGADCVHLGGGVSAEDGLFRFKESFGGRRTRFFTGAVVLDPAGYDRLVAHRAAELGRTPPELVATGYFPAFRFGSGLL